jgi:hypothetical protein
VDISQFDTSQFDEFSDWEMVRLLARIIIRRANQIVVHPDDNTYAKRLILERLAQTVISASDKLYHLR